MTFFDSLLEITRKSLLFNVVSPLLGMCVYFSVPKYKLHKTSKSKDSLYCLYLCTQISFTCVNFKLSFDYVINLRPYPTLGI